MASEIARAITPEPTEEHQIPQAESVKVRQSTRVHLLVEFLFWLLSWIYEHALPLWWSKLFSDVPGNIGHFWTMPTTDLPVDGCGHLSLAGLLL